MAFKKFPYTNFHELNLDWIIATIKQLNNDITNINNDLANIENNISDVVNTVFEEKITTGQLSLSLNVDYDPTTEALTFTQTGE